MLRLVSRVPCRAAVAVLAAALLLALFPLAPAFAAEPPADPRASQLLVKFSRGADARQRAQARREEGVQHVRDLSVPGLELVQLPDTVATDAHARDLAAHPLIDYAEPNQLQQAMQVPDDPRFGELWGLHNTGQNVGGSIGTPGIDVGAVDAWQDFGRGNEELIVAVLDEGVQLDHPDLRDNLWVNTGEVCGNSIDDDANGYVDDCNGWDFFHGDNTVFDAADGDDHGTHVAGTIAATADNAQGVAGVAPNVRIMPLKWLGPEGGWVSDMIEALAYAKAKGARITNGSYGGGYSAAQRDAMISSGLFHVVSAGNDNVNMDAAGAPLTYPCAYALANSVCVAAITSSGNRASFSNYGTQYVDVAAPGVVTLSAYPGSAYALKSGTSMASPHVTGVAALLASVEPSLTNAQLKAAITSTTTPLAAMAGKVATGGMVKARPALVAAVARPSRPTAPAVAMQDGAGSVQVSWTAPAHAGATAISGYKVWARQGNAAPAATTVAGAGATSTVLTGLQPGATCTFWVTATNGSGDGVASEERTLTLSAAPAAPTGLAATPGNGKLRLSWTAPADNGAAITGYTVHVDDGSGPVAHAASGTSTVVSGLANGTAHTVTVTATNSVGESPASAAVFATPQLSVPEAPVSAQVAEGDTQLTLTWQPPADDGGSAITAYTAYLHDGQAEVSAALDTGARAHTFTALTPGKAYTLSVTATNGIGEGARSAGLAARPLSVPDAPTGVAATAGTQQATVTWTAPAYTGGQALTGNEVTVSPATGVTGETTRLVGSASTSLVFTGLSAGTGYTFTVRALNAMGASVASAPSAAVTPAAPAPPPSSGGGGGGGGGGGAAPAPVAPSPTPTPSPTAAPSPDTQTTQRAEVEVPAQGGQAVPLSVELPAGTVALRLEGVTSGGTVAVSQIDAPERAGYLTLPAGFDVDLGDVRADQAQLCMPLPVRALRDAGLLPAEVRLWHVDADGSREDITSDVSGGQVCGVATEFSPFVLGVAAAGRLSGPDRAATAAAVSAQRFAPGVPVAFVASAERFADALAAAPAAAELGGPLLLTGASALPAATAAELARLRPGRIVLVGGPGVVSQEVADALAAQTSGAVTRVAGPDRFSTAAAVSELAGAAGGTVYMATGQDFPDALAGGAAAAAEGAPVLLTGRDELPEATRAALERLAPARVVVLGGLSAVSEAVAAQAASGGAQVVRLSGADRYATAAAVAERFTGEAGVVYVATGEGFADALAGVPAASLHGAPLLLTGREHVPAATAEALARIAPQRIVVLGGVSAVSETVTTQLATHLR